MKTKKIISLILILIFSLSLTPMLSACGEEEPTVMDNPQDAPTTEEPEDFPTTEEPTDKPTNEPEDSPTDEPTDEPEDTPTTEEPTDKPTNEPEDSPTTDEPTDSPTTEEPTDGPASEPNDSPTTDEPTVDDPSADLYRNIVLIESGKAYFNFIVADGSSSNLNRAVDTIISDLAKLGATTQKLADKASTITDCEVLIGNINSRGEAYKINPHTYGYDGYLIEAIDGKVIILGGSEEALINAIEVFKKDILGIKKSTKKLSDVTMTAERKIEVIQDNYKIDGITVAGFDLKDFVLIAKDGESKEISAATALQEHLYKKAGIWLDIADGASQKKAIIIDLTTPADCSSENGFILKVTDGNILIDCGFANKIDVATLGFFMSEITNGHTLNPTLENGYVYEKVDYKNIYYKDYGAVGDGVTDDFLALMKCHEEANQYGHIVNAEPDATYYLGKGSGYNTITIQTDTNWNGCKFIFDDSKIKAPPYYPGTNTPTGERGDPEYYTPIFTVKNSAIDMEYTAVSSPIKSLYEGVTNIGFAPGYEALIIPYNSNIYQFIRYGKNQNDGAAQQEVIHVDKDGNIDPMTPVQWSYDEITKLVVYNAEESPITINGGDERQAHVLTDFNNAPSNYTYYSRNIKITRSNVTIKNIKHDIINEGATGAPYNGFITITNANNVVVDGCEFYCPKGYKTTGSAGLTVSMGTYELNAVASTNILWSNCTQSNLYKEDGSMQADGMMGTNYCKNLMFENMVVCSFDAHCGTYNATLRNSTCEHINFIGEGTILLENMTILANPAGNGLVLRSGYGSTWQGDLIIKGLNMKYYSRKEFSLINAAWTNHFFGYETYLPENIYIEDVRLTKIGYAVDAEGNRTEWSVEQDEMPPLNLYLNLNEYTDVDISDPNAVMDKYPTDDAVSCECKNGFNDTTGDGLCDNSLCGLPQSGNPNVNVNPYTVTKNVYIKNCPGLKIIMPQTPAFKNTKVYVWKDASEEYEYEYWWQEGYVECVH